MIASSDAGALEVVSVILASRDGERFLPLALASIAAQTWPHLEILLVDDGSTDGTPRLLETFAARDRRARVLRAGGMGAAAARHLAAREATGEFLAIQDDDDVSRPERIARAVEYLRDHPATGLVGSRADRIDERGQVIGPYDVPVDPEAVLRLLRRAPPFVHGSVTMRRTAYLEAGGYRRAFQAAEDYDLYLRIAPLTGLANLRDRLVAWREHPGNSFARRRDDHLFYMALARLLAWERERQGTDSLAAFEAAGSREAFFARSPLRSRLALYWGAALVRDGRVEEGRRVLEAARSDPALAFAALAWQAVSYPVALSPRAARARAAKAAR